MLSRRPGLRCYHVLCIGLLAFCPSGCGTNLTPNAPESSGSSVDRATITQNISSSTWGVAVRIGVVDPIFVTLGTAFAVDSRRLVTNAHVVDGILELAPQLAADERIGVVQHETGIFVAIEEIWKHPDYDPNFFLSTPDVAVLTVDAIFASYVTLAGDSVVSSLSVLDSISLCGFPGDVTFAIDVDLGSSRPRVTCLSGSVSALRPFDPSDPASPSNTFLVQHDIQTSVGTSGSAIFDEAGRVIAINSAGTIDDSSSNRFAVRIDLVRSFLNDIDNGRVGSVVLEQFVGTVPGVGSAQCPTSRYRNDEFGFGFDPPRGFFGPLPFDNLRSDRLFDVKFEKSEFVHIRAAVAPTVGSLSNWLDGLILLRSHGGDILLSEEVFHASTGTPAVIQSWLSPGTLIDLYWIELWYVSNGLRYSLDSLLLQSDFFTFRNTIKNSFRSFCAD